MSNKAELKAESNSIEGKMDDIIYISKPGNVEDAINSVKSLHEELVLFFENISIFKKSYTMPTFKGFEVKYSGGVVFLSSLDQNIVQVNSIMPLSKSSSHVDDYVYVQTHAAEMHTTISVRIDADKSSHNYLINLVGQKAWR